MVQQKKWIKIKAPLKGTCQICAFPHKKDEMHEVESLYYKLRFFNANHRLPTFEDAIAHCSETQKEAYRKSREEREVESGLDQR